LLTPPEKQTASLAVEKRKKGKVVTVVRGLPSEENDLPALLGRLKTACGAGGTIRDDLLDIQGKHLERVRGLLAGIGYRVRGCPSGAALVTDDMEDQRGNPFPVDGGSDLGPESPCLVVQSFEDLPAVEDRPRQVGEDGHQ
jgi:predicted translation initiation factor SUI1